MMTKAFFLSISSVLAVAGHAFAEQLPPPIEIDPTYQECAKLAQEALDAEANALARGQDVPPATFKSAQEPNILPGLAGGQDFEKALKESGVRIVVDPNNPDATPQIEFESLPKMAASSDEEEEKTLTPEDIAAQKRHVCRIKFGIQF